MAISRACPSARFNIYLRRDGERRWIVEIARRYVHYPGSRNNSRWYDNDTLVQGEIVLISFRDPRVSFGQLDQGQCETSNFVFFYLQVVLNFGKFCVLLRVMRV